MTRSSDAKEGVVLKKMEEHQGEVWAVMVSRDGELIASGGKDGKVIVWHRDSLTEAIKAYSDYIHSLDFSPEMSTTLEIL